MAFGVASMDEVIEMHKGNLAVTWLVDRMIEHQAPALLHAAPKCCKTTLALDLAIACATGGHWLGRKAMQTPVMVVSVENGAKNLIHSIGLLCKSRGVAVPKETLHLGTQLDNIADEGVLRELTAYMHKNSIGLAIFDPAYLILGEYRQTEMNDVGGKLYRISSACQSVGATCMFLHHSKSSGGAGLKAAAGAGFSNWPSSWMSVSRIGTYKLDGRHKLKMQYGGRWAQQGTMDIEIDEGIVDDVATKCEVSVVEKFSQKMLFPFDQIEPEKKARKRLSEKDVLAALSEPSTVNAVKERLGGSRTAIQRMVSSLVERGKASLEGGKYVAL